MSKKHYPISPSATTRILNCPGSIDLSKDSVQIESSHAREGTMAHDVAEAAASGNDLPDEATEEMIESANQWKNTIEWIEKDHLIIDRWLERTLESCRNKDFGGTPDYHSVSPDSIIIGDYKYGKGIKVSAKNNSQLMSYLCLARESHKRADRFIAFILQPRLNHFDMVEFTSEQLDEFESRLFLSATKKELLVGDHCKWCPATTKCPKLWREVVDLFGDESDDWTPPSLAKQLEMLPRLKELVERIPKEAVERFKQGQSIDGFKLVHRMGRRSFTADENTIMEKLESLNVPKERYTKTLLLSPAQMEKQGLGDIIKEFIETPQKGFTVASCDDPREEVKGEPNG